MERVQLQPSTLSALYSTGRSMDIDIPSTSSAAPSMPEMKETGNSNAAAPGQSSSTPNCTQPGARGSNIPVIEPAPGPSSVSGAEPTPPPPPTSAESGISQVLREITNLLPKSRGRR